MLGEDTCEGVRGAARWKWHDNGEGARWIDLRAHRERPHRRAAEQRDEVAAFHQQFLPCFEAEDSTAADLLHCGISSGLRAATGSIATDRHTRDAHAMSALPPIAYKHSHCSETPLCAKSGHLHCSRFLIRSPRRRVAVESKGRRGRALWQS